MRIDGKPEMGTGEGVDCVAPRLLTRQIVIIDVASIVITVSIDVVVVIVFVQTTKLVTQLDTF